MKRYWKWLLIFIIIVTLGGLISVGWNLIVIYWALFNNPTALSLNVIQKDIWFTLILAFVSIILTIISYISLLVLWRLEIAKTDKAKSILSKVQKQVKNLEYESYSITKLRQELLQERSGIDNSQLSNITSNESDHISWIESLILQIDELSQDNQSLVLEIDQLHRVHQALDQKVLELEQENADLQIMLENTTEHADTVEFVLHTKAEEAIKQSERKLAQFMEAIPVGIGVLDAKGRVYYLNQKAKEILGLGMIKDLSEISLTHNIYIADTNQPYPLEELPIIKALKGESVTLDNLEIVTPNKIIPIESRGTPIVDDMGHILYAINAFVDITERKKIEAERIKFTNELAEALQAQVKLTDAYGRFVPHEFLQLLGYDSILDIELGQSVEQELTIVFSDIRDFTKLSEQMKPEDNFKFINGYLSRMEPAISEHHGFIDKFIGDAIMGLFTTADDAIQASISMIARLREYNKTRKTKERQPIKIGIGINTGLSMLGTVGGDKRMDGTVISDAVNLASRIESLTKYYGVSLLISNYTFASLNDPNQYCIRFIDRVLVKGKSELVSLFEVFDADLPETKRGKLITRTIFEKAMLLYNERSFKKAARLFRECFLINPRDKVAQIYLELCEQQE